MGTWVADYVCEGCVQTLPPVTMAPGRPSVNSCGMDQMTALLGLSQGDMSQVANLGDECGPCILADPDDPCPCMDSTMCPLASCTPEECVYTPAVSEETTTTTTTGGTTTTNEKGTTTDAYEFSSAPAVSCLLAVLVPVLL